MASYHFAGVDTYIRCFTAEEEALNQEPMSVPAPRGA